MLDPLRQRENSLLFPVISLFFEKCAAGIHATSFELTSSMIGVNSKPSTSEVSEIMASRTMKHLEQEDQLQILPVNLTVNWPALSVIGLSSKEITNRGRGVGGSDANVIMSGDRDRIEQLWRVKQGTEAPEDLTGCLPVMLGSWTEAFNRQWYEQIEGYLVDQVGASLTCPKHEWRRCTLDGFVTARGAVWEAKHTNAFSKPDEILSRYMPQLQHNMAVARADRAILSVIFGNHKWQVYEVGADWLYQEELFIAEARFWDCVRTGERPIPAAPLEAPRPVGVREVCLEGNNEWASAAYEWLLHKEAAKKHSAASVQIKSLVEDDVSRAFGHQVEAKRSKSGAITIKEITG